MEEVITITTIIQSFFIGGILSIVFGVLGVYVLQRGLSFWGDGIAHASLAGIAVALLTGWQPLILALIVALLFAIGIFFLEAKTKLSKDTMIGILFTSLMSIGLLLAANLEEGHHELEAFLFGDLSEIMNFDAGVIILFSIVILGLVYKYKKELAYISIDQQGAYMAGMPVKKLNLMFYCILAIAVVLAAKVMGVILVSALLIIPAAAAQLSSNSLAHWRSRSVIFSLISVIFGLIFSLFFELPSGPVIILTSTLLFVISLALSKRSV